MKHLVLGSAGQVGSYLVDYLETVGEEVYRWDIVDGERYDLANPQNFDSLQTAIWRADYVHFLAFDVGGSAYLKKYQNTQQFISNNVRLMEHTFEALKVAGTPFTFASSQMSNMLDSNYGILKALGESYTHTLNGINVRFWNVYGYERNPEKSHVITDFIKMALESGTILMRTDGTEQRMFLYAQDAAQILFKTALKHDKLLESMRTDAQRYDSWYSLSGCKALPITTRDWTSVLDVARIVADLIPNTTIYRGLDKDMTQTIRNEPDTNHMTSFYDIINHRSIANIPLDAGIERIIRLIEDERKI